MLAALAAGLVAIAPGPDLAHAEEPDLEISGTLRVEVGEGQRLEVDGARHYLDALEFPPDRDVLINDVTIEDYVAGVAEMPASWPLEALKAQAVAARTYAWYVQRTGRYDGFDICATVSCQVFRGAEVVDHDNNGARWQQAVDDTAGEVLVDDEGEPVLARYFSTSGGRTFANEEVFPSSGPQDHLVGIDDPYDEVSPYHRWEVRFPREDFDTLAARGERLSAAVPIAELERLGDVDDPSATIRVTGEDGTEVEVGAGDLRDFLSRMAPDSFPDRYPPLRSDGLGALPSTIPTARYDIGFEDDEVVILGRGWGHGVGLGQYGARGRADDGDDYLDILTAYYDGLQPTTTEDLPERLRVGISSEPPVTVRPDGPMRLLADGDVVEERALGTWELSPGDGGWVLTPPAGHGRDLEVGTTTQVDGLQQASDAVTVEVEVNKPVELLLEVTDDQGATVLERDLGVVDAGRHTAVWRLDDQQGSLANPGTYRIGLYGQDHAGDHDGAPTELTLPLEPADGAERGWSTSALQVAAVAVGLLAILAAAILVTRRSR